MNRSLILLPISFLIFLALQVMLFQRIVLFETAFCMFYTAFILFAPIEISAVVLMLIGFVFGLSIDWFQNSAGVHASSTVLLAFLRNYWLQLITPQGGYDSAGSQSFNGFGFLWLLTYIAPLLFIHLFTLFFVEAGGFNMFWETTGKVFSSFIFTLSALLLYQFFTSGRR
jgi:hypothetical protein